MKRKYVELPDGEIVDAPATWDDVDEYDAETDLAYETWRAFHEGE